jgi:hypothetical protein
MKVAYLSENWVNSPFSHPDIAGQTLLILSLMLLKVAYNKQKIQFGTISKTFFWRWKKFRDKAVFKTKQFQVKILMVSNLDQF